MIKHICSQSNLLRVLPFLGLAAAMFLVGCAGTASTTTTTTTTDRTKSSMYAR